MMIGCMGTNCKRKSVPINDSHNLHTLATLGFTDACTTAFCGGKGGIYKALPFIYLSLLSKRIGKTCQYIAEHFVSAPVLKTAMNCFVIRKA